MANLYDVRVQSGSRLSTVEVEAHSKEEAAQIASGAGYEVKETVFRGAVPTRSTLTRDNGVATSNSVAWGVVKGLVALVVLVFVIFVVMVIIDPASRF